MKTIKQIADELGVSKEAVRKRLPTLPTTTLSKAVNGAIQINAGGEALLRASINSKAKTANQLATDNAMFQLQLKVEKLELEKELKDKHFMEQIEIYNRELRRKDALIDVMNEAIAELTSTIKAQTEAISAAQLTTNTAQALHAGTIQQQLTDGHAVPAEPDATPGFFSRLSRAFTKTKS